MGLPGADLFVYSDGPFDKWFVLFCFEEQLGSAWGERNSTWILY